MNFILNNNYFKTQKETKIFIQSLITRNHFKNILPSNEDYKCIYDLLKLHSEYENKKGEGIEYFYIKKHPKYNNFCIWIKQKNNKELVNFSWYECLKKKKTTKLQDFKKALRTTIQPQIYEYKNSIKNKICSICSNDEKIHVDHIIHFQKLVEDFLKINKEDIPLKYYKNKLLELEFKEEDKTIKNNWYNYHLENSKLRLLCSKCNLKRKKYKS